MILKLPFGRGLALPRRRGDALAIEESVYLGGGALRRGEQLVITGQVKDAPVECAWLLEQVTTA